MDRLYCTYLSSVRQLEGMELGQDVDAIQSARGRVSKDDSLPLVSLQNASLGYDSEPVLQNVDLTIYPGDLIGLAGPNGSGKTTLFRAILGLLPILGGALSRNCPLSNFGYVPQSAALDAQFPLSTAEVVEMGAYGRIRPYEFFPAEEKKQIGESSRTSWLAALGDAIFFFSLRRSKAAHSYRPGSDGAAEDHDFGRASFRSGRRVPKKY